MTKGEAKFLIRQGVKVRHNYFSDGEWVTMDNGEILMEDGVRCSWDEFWWWRETQSYFEEGWEVYTKPGSEPIPDLPTISIASAVYDLETIFKVLSGPNSYQLKVLRAINHRTTNLQDLYNMLLGLDKAKQVVQQEIESITNQYKNLQRP